ncbi:uncharacterized protein LOC130940111 [Arachis stenosperma]|uniref:uncharacterized protein LOC130940111 n=1 Tax=Arachis stenosperma TaxID=217475 RepID=UPI0025AD5A6A|nr:uncharacterized protein LOC130940111 [Arachis stenosperma]
MEGPECLSEVMDRSRDGIMLSLRDGKGFREIVRSRGKFSNPPTPQLSHSHHGSPPSHARLRRRASRRIHRIVCSRRIHGTLVSRRSPPLVIPRVLVAIGVALSASYSARPPSLHPTPGVLHCSRLASLPAAVLPGECSRLFAPPSLPRLSSTGVAACTDCRILPLQQQLTSMDGNVLFDEGNNEEANNNNNGTISNSKDRKRRNYMLDDDSPKVARQKLAKRILLSLTNPSYVLRLGSKSLRLDYCTRLRYLLTKLVKEHDWATASGVLSAYLKGTMNDKSPFRNCLKFSVLLELLKRVENYHINPTRMKNLFDIWLKNIGSMKSWPIESRYRVHVEFILFCLVHGNTGDAYQLVISLEQEKVDLDPVSKIIMGLTYYTLWYSSIPEEFQWKDSDQADLQKYSRMEGPSISNEVGQSEWHNTVESFLANSQSHCESDTSVLKDKHISRDVGFNNGVGESMEIDVDHRRKASHQNLQPGEGFRSKSEENEGSRDSFSNHGGLTQDTLNVIRQLDLWLFPLDFPDDNSFEDFMYAHSNQQNDHYKKAVKYLQLALDSAPSVTAALLPLIQLLLIGGRVEEALILIEKECSNSSSVLPVRLRAAFLECSDRNNSDLIVTCFEDMLKKDPRESYPLAKLIRMYQNGDYSLESLFEMIVLHLDATSAEYSTWRMLSSCFFKLSCYEEDSISANHTNEDGDRQHYSFRKTPKVFTQEISGMSWRLRCRSWLLTHFSHRQLNSDVEGDLQLLTYKAACASHMYGQDFHYVSKAYFVLENENNKDLLLILGEHRQNSFEFYQQFQNKLKL